MADPTPTAPAAEDALVEALMRAMAMHFSMNRMPHMSGDPLNRLGAMERRRLDDAARAALTALRAARPDVAAVLDGKAVAVPRVATAEMVAAPGYEGRDNEMRGIFWLMATASPYAAPGDAP